MKKAYTRDLHHKAALLKTAVTPSVDDRDSALWGKPETASMAQCTQFAGNVTRTIINSKLQAQFHCLSDSEYRTEVLKELP